MRAVRLFFLLALALSFPARLRAQDFDSTADRLLVGTVQIAPGVPPPGRAIVSLYNRMNMEIAKVSTNSSGSFTFLGIGAGDFRIVARLEGFQDGRETITVYQDIKMTHVPAITLRPFTDILQSRTDKVD